tara:strand:+ start:45648 stop:45845 length:198 start_codon:yes stop_codon:yes gene_type:complete
MNYYKLTTPRLIMFIVFIVTGLVYFSKTDLSKLTSYEIIISILIFVILTLLVLSKILNFKKLKKK